MLDICVLDIMCVCVQINTAKKRYEVGLSKLAATETSVSAMQVSLQGCIAHKGMRLYNKIKETPLLECQDRPILHECLGKVA